MVTYLSAIQRYRWYVIAGAILLLQSAPPIGKIIGVFLLCAVALSDHNVLLLVVPATAPLYLMPVALNTTAAIPLHEIIWLVAITTWGLARWRQRLPLVAWMPSDRWVGALLICAVISVALALPEGRGEALRWLRWLFIEPVIWYLCLRTALTTSQITTRQLVNTMLTSAGIVATIGILQAVGIDMVPWLGSKRAFSDNIVNAGNINRVASVYGHPNNLGLFLERIWPFALVSVLVPQWRTRLGVALLVICAGGLLVTFSRGAWLATGLASALLVVWFYGARIIQQKPWIIMAVITLGIAGAVFALLTRGTSVGSFDARVLLWRESITWLQHKPWGLGLGQFYFYHNPEYGHSIIDPSLIGTSEQYAAHPHNLLLDAWLNLGPWGVVVLIGLLVHAWRRSLRITTTQWLAVAAGIMLVAASVHGLVDQFFFVSDIAYCFWVAQCIIAVDTAPTTRL